MIIRRWRLVKSAAWLSGLLSLASLSLLMDSCVQLRMSKTEIDAYFAKRDKKGTLHTYPVGTTRVMNYLKVGDENKPLVIFVHGSPGSLSSFIDFMGDTALLKKAQLITVDRPGFGSSDFGDAEPSLEKQAAYIKPILEANQDHRPIIVVGHSLGGPVVSRMAMDYQELIDGLVLVAGSIDPDLEPNETWFRAPLATPFLKWLLPRSFRAANDELYKLKPELIKMLPLWDKITCRVIVIQGMKDSLVPAANAEFARKNLTHVRSVEFMFNENMDHFVPWSNPEMIREAILKMLQETKADLAEH